MAAQSLFDVSSLPCPSGCPRRWAQEDWQAEMRETCSPSGGLVAIILRHPLQVSARSQQEGERRGGSQLLGGGCQVAVAEGDARPPLLQVEQLHCERPNGAPDLAAARAGVLLQLLLVRRGITGNARGAFARLADLCALGTWECVMVLLSSRHRSEGERGRIGIG